MLRLDDHDLVLAATDLTNHLACAHLTQQRIAIARGERSKPKVWVDPHAELVRERGDEHESAELARLEAECGGAIDLTGEVRYDHEGLTIANGQASEAMHDGAPLIYQPTLYDGEWQGRADFLRRVERPSDLGPYSYEVLDTKLARQVSPRFVHQLALYSLLVAKIQGLVPENARVILGDGTTETIRLGDFLALHRHVRLAMATVVSEAPADTYPEPVDHCAVRAFLRRRRGNREANRPGLLVKLLEWGLALQSRRPECVCNLRLAAVGELLHAKYIEDCRHLRPRLVRSGRGTHRLGQLLGRWAAVTCGPVVALSRPQPHPRSPLFALSATDDSGSR